MKVTKTNFEGLLIVEPDIYRDDRGLFLEAYNCKTFTDAGMAFQFVQDNQSHSVEGVIRGLHFQNAPKAQAKLVRVLQGSILDVVVDLRKDQPTYKQVHVIELSRENGKQLMVPKGFGHGFSVLSYSADLLYKTDELYSPAHEGGINVEDPELNIDWKVDPGKKIVSLKDKALPFLRDARFNF